MAPSEIEPVPTPYFHVPDFLDAATHRALIDAVEAHKTFDGGEHWAVLEARIRAMAGVVRRELGLERFHIEEIDRRLTVHDGAGFDHTENQPTRSAATPRVGFIYTFQPPESWFTGGTLRLHDSLMCGDIPRAADTCAELAPDDNAIVFFPADRHHEVTRVRETGDHPARRYAISGLLRGDPRTIGPREADPDVRRVLQQRYLPTFSSTDFQVRPSPEPVQRLLEALLELRGSELRPEPSDPAYLPTGDPEFVDVHDFGEDLLRWLQPLHEEFAGVPLQPSNVYGLRVYRPGDSLIMHVDRGETHVISSVLQVAQDVDEPWPLVIEGRGATYEVVLGPGQMLLYEGAVRDHGRPTPLRGRSFVNLFAHYRPVEWPWSSEELTMRAFRDGVIDLQGQLSVP